jgi:hypothetical protein
MPEPRRSEQDTDAAVEAIRTQMADRVGRIRGHVWLYLETFSEGYSRHIFETLRAEPDGRDVTIRHVQHALADMVRDGVLVIEFRPGDGRVQKMGRNYYRLARRGA